jgi:hypothetical protein
MQEIQESHLHVYDRSSGQSTKLEHFGRDGASSEVNEQELLPLRPWDAVYNSVNCFHNVYLKNDIQTT